jgi:DeoR family transcriptional regulator, copper-sensing transcriptional repressor
MIMSIDLPSERQTFILDWLRETRALSIEQIAQRLGVSTMTIHRDIAQLTREGVVEKVHGGVTLPRKIANMPAQAACKLCVAPILERTSVILQPAQGDTLYACCPHCGIMLLGEADSTVAALARDFIYGRMVNMRQAVYLLQSDIHLCCVPSVLCFASHEDAARFQVGFGGTLYSFDGLYQELRGSHHHGHSHPAN